VGKDSPRHPLIPPEITMNAIHHDIAALNEAADTTTAAAPPVAATAPPLAELTSV
jgi:hypothetical protein